MTASKYTEELRKIILFDALDESQIELINQRCQWMTYIEGQQIIGQSDPSTDVFFVIEGTVRAKSYSQAGKEVSFVDINAGTLFGEFSAIDGQARASSIISLTPCTLALMSAKDFRLTLGEIPGVALKLIDLLVKKTRSLSERVFEFSTLPVKDRINIALLRLAEQVESDGKTAIIHPAPTHQELAARISTHREAVTRELNQLVSKEIITLRRGRIEVINMPLLRSLVDLALSD